MDGSDVETIAALARNRVAGSLERNGLAESGFDLMKGLGIGFVLGRVSLCRPWARGDSVISDFTGRQPVPVRDYVVSIEGGPKLRNHVSKVWRLLV